MAAYQTSSTRILCLSGIIAVITLLSFVDVPKSTVRVDLVAKQKGNQQIIFENVNNNDHIPLKTQLLLGLGSLSSMFRIKKHYYPNNDEMYNNLYKNIGCRNMTDEQKETSPCGAAKCWFPDKTNASVGYLIAHDIKINTWPDFMNGWKNARMLERKYNIAHSQLEAPHRLVTPRQTEIDLLSCLRFQAKPNPGDVVHFLDRPRIPLIVQANRPFPDPAIQLRAPYSKNDETGRQPRSEKRIIKHLKESVSNLTEFLQNAENDMTLAIEVLKNEKYLCMDYQVMLDKHGHLHYFDMRGQWNFRDVQLCIDYMRKARQVIRDTVASMGK